MPKRDRSEEGEESEAPLKRTKSTKGADENEENDDLDLSQNPDFYHNPTMGSEGEVGIIERVTLRNFMCHASLDVPFSPQVNFVIGHNGSGKSAVLTGLVIGLGGKANVTNRGSSIKSFIKNGKQTAEIIVHLRNRGEDAYKENLYGKTIIVERKITREGSSFYKLKNADNKVVSTKREELTHILDEFNIQVDNPVSILNQDTSRNFLHSKSPHDKYKFFLKATQLQQMKSDYVHAHKSKTIALEILQQKQQTLPTLEKEVNEWDHKFQALSALDGLKSQIDKLKNEMAWAHVLLSEKESEAAFKELRIEEGRTPKFMQKVEESKTKLNIYVIQQKEIQERLQALESEGKSLHADHKEAKQAKDQKKKEEKIIQLEKRKVSNEISSVIKDKSQIEERIEEIKSSIQKDFQAERKVREDRILLLQEEKRAKEAVRKTTEHQMQQHSAAVNKLKKDQYRYRMDSDNLKANMVQLTRLIKQLEGSRSNRMGKYHVKMPEVMKRIENAVMTGKFHKKPIGPLGAYITLNDQKWALACELALGNLLKAFCCHDTHDAIELEKIVKQIIPDSRFTYITSPFLKKAHDISRNKVQSEHPCLIDLLDIDNPVVSNCLIDQRGVENVAMISDQEEARQIMNRNPPHNCKEAFTMQGDQAYCKPSFKYYSAPKGYKASLLTANIEDDIRAAKEEYSQADLEYKKCVEKCRQVDSEIRINQKEEHTCRTHLMKIVTTIGNLDFEIRELSSKEDPSPIDVTTLEEEVEHYKAQIIDLEQKKVLTDSKFEVARKELEIAERLFKDIDQRLKSITDSVDPIKEEQALIDQKIERAKGEKKHYDNKLKDHQKKLEEYRQTAEHKQKLLMVDISKAEQICERVRTRRTPQNIENEINQIQKRICSEEKLRGCREEIITRTKETRVMYEKIKVEVNQLNNFLKALDKVMKNRQTQFFEFRRMIALRAKYFFIVMLSNRNCSGKIHFDHGKENLNMTVQPTTVNGEGSRDLKSLSGGERSFATVCFILALWDAMESPFRCLDEFDVFMDMVNRRIAMDMMLDVAQQHSGHQFIFLTPQDMSHLGMKTYVRIFQMPSPERGQTLLPFRRQNEADEDEAEAS